MPITSKSVGARHYCPKILCLPGTHGTHANSSPVKGRSFVLNYKFSKKTELVFACRDFKKILCCVCALDTVQDFLIKLGIKPRLHILKISIFSLNHVIVRPTKIMNNLLKVCKICTFKVIFRHQKSTESF